jgi:ADP-heptose:LPS heptosyltransferase
MQKSRWQQSEQALEPEASRLARNLAELGDANLDEPESWNLHLTDAETARAKEVLAPAASRLIIAVSVGTKVQSKDWGRDNWRALLNRLAAQYPDHALALCGASEESEASEFAAEGWRENSRTPVINLCGLLTPRESAAAIAHAQIFVGHDSGPMHLAAAVQTPCVAIFAARNKPRVWFPYGKQHRVLYHQTDCWGCGLETCTVEKKKCLTSIKVDEVVTEVRAILG